MAVLLWQTKTKEPAMKNLFLLTIIYTAFTTISSSFVWQKWLFCGHLPAHYHLPRYKLPQQYVLILVNFLLLPRNGALSWWALILINSRGRIRDCVFSNGKLLHCDRLSTRVWYCSTGNGKDDGDDTVEVEAAMVVRIRSLWWFLEVYFNGNQEEDKMLHTWAWPCSAAEEQEEEGNNKMRRIVDETRREFYNINENSME